MISENTEVSLDYMASSALTKEWWETSADLSKVLRHLGKLTQQQWRGLKMATTSGQLQ